MKTSHFRFITFAAVTIFAACTGSGLLADGRNNEDRHGRGSAHHDAPSHHSAPTHFIAHHAEVPHFHPAFSSAHDGFHHSFGVAHRSEYVTRLDHHEGHAISGYASPQNFVASDHHLGGVIHHGSSFAHFNGGGHHSGWAGYAVRHEHHSRVWYRDNGWFYDSDYWRLHHRHCYFNDELGCVIFDSIGPGFDEGYVSPQSYVYAEPRPPVFRENGPDNDTSMAVQDALAQAGYYHGEVDGVVGPMTREAIADYQQEHGLRVTGLINDALISSLGLR